MRLFVDMDGVLAVFHKDKSLEEIMTPGYFENLEPMLNMIAALKIICDKYGDDVCVLSSSFDESREEKKIWCKKFLPFIKEEQVSFVRYGTPKNDFIYPEKDDFLLDDFTKNLLEWRGTGIKFLNGINHTHRTWKGYVVNGESDPITLANAIIGIIENAA